MLDIKFSRVIITMPHPVCCPHGLWHIQCKECNSGGICIHGNIRELCDTCIYSELCHHNIRKMRCHVCRKSNLKQSSIYYTLCSALEKVSHQVLPPQLSKFVPKNERLSTIQEHIANLSKGSERMNSLP